MSPRLESIRTCDLTTIRTSGRGSQALGEVVGRYAEGSSAGKQDVLDVVASYLAHVGQDALFEVFDAWSSARDYLDTCGCEFKPPRSPVLNVTVSADQSHGAECIDRFSHRLVGYVRALGQLRGRPSWSPFEHGENEVLVGAEPDRADDFVQSGRVPPSRRP